MQRELTLMDRSYSRSNRIFVTTAGLWLSILVSLAWAGSGADAMQKIDWASIGPYAPIPSGMPTGRSDDPLDAGFAPEWIEHALPPTEFASSKLAVEIMSKHRSPGDRWAYLMENELRAIIGSKVPKATIYRVFCNSVGCLCYVERDEAVLENPLVYLELIGPTGQRYGLKRLDLDAAIHVSRPGTPWELTVVRRPAGGAVPVTAPAPGAHSEAGRGSGA